MKILNLSLDSKILENNSSFQRRVLEYGELVDRYDVIVPGGRNKKISLSEKIDIFASGGRNKFCQFKNFYKLGRSFFQKNMYDVVTAQDQYFLALIGLKLAKKFKAGFEMQVHGFEKYYGARKIIFKFLIKRADSVRVVSERLKIKLIDEFKIEEGKITVAPIFNQLRTQNCELREKKVDDKFVFLTAGRLVPVKNIKMQIRAIAVLQKKYPNIKLLIIGDGEERRSLEAESEKLKVNVEFLGWRDDVENIYKKADVFLLTSDSEGWGMVVIEAAGFGLPIIMTDVGCAGEAIKDHESGLIIPVGDAGALEEAMSKIIKDNKLRKDLSNGAIEAIKNLPSKAEIFGRYKESWTKALKYKE